MNSGENILTLVRSMQKLNAEIAALLKTFDKLAGDRGYRNEGGNQITKDVSQSIDSPEYWTPPWMYRILQNKANRDDVLVLNISLDYPDEPELVKEPLVLCARFKYKKGTAQTHTGDWDPWDLWFLGPSKNLNQKYAKGDLNLDSKQFLEDADWGKSIKDMQELSFVAVPLAAMVDSKTFEREVLRRVL